MVEVQLDFFKSEEQCEIDALHSAVASIKLSSDKVRKGTYARINEIGKRQDELELRLGIIERNICKGATCH